MISLTDAQAEFIAEAFFDSRDSHDAFEKLLKQEVSLFQFSCWIESFVESELINYKEFKQRLAEESKRACGYSEDHS